MSRRAPGSGPEALDRIRVLHVINQLGPGGAERSLADLVAPLSERGVDVEVACVFGVSPEYREHYLPPCEVWSLTGKTLLGKALDLRRRLRASPPRLVHTTLFEANVVGRLGTARLEVPAITSLVNTEYEPIRRGDPNVGRMKLELARLIERWTGRLFTTHYHAITEAVKTSAIRYLGIPEPRISVVHRGRDPETLGLPGADRRARVRRSLGVPDDAEIVLQVGRQEYQKGHEFLLQAVARLRPKRPELQALVAGRRGNTSDRLDELHRALALGGSVRFLGSRPDIGDLLAAADLFVFPSLYEGLGGAVIEAMALGLPIVASDLPALREIIEKGRNAVLVPPGDPEALATAIDALLKDRERACRFGARSREIFLERFTIDSSAEAMARLYRDVLQGVFRDE